MVISEAFYLRTGRRFFGVAIPHATLIMQIGVEEITCA